MSQMLRVLLVALGVIALVAPVPAADESLATPANVQQADEPQSETEVEEPSLLWPDDDSLSEGDDRPSDVRTANSDELTFDNESGEEFVFENEVGDEKEFDEEPDRISLHEEWLLPESVINRTESASEFEGVEEILEEVVEAVEEGRRYNDPGWYRAPEWGDGIWRSGHSGRFGEFSTAGADASPIRAWPGLSFTFGHGFHFLDGPTASDLPPRLFEFSAGLHWFGEVTDGWWADLAYSAGVYTDFEDSTREGWRIPAHAVVTCELSPSIQPVVGVQYLDRHDWGLLPVAGVILRPDDEARIELVFPEPKAAWRVSSNDESEHWLSLAGQIGGGEWAIERAQTGLADVVTYNAYQLVLALETAERDGTITSIDIGYVFERDIEYASSRGNFEPSETMFVRLTSRK